MTYQQQNRFMGNNLPTNQQANRYSISDYEDLPLLPLEEAVKEIIQLIPHIIDSVAIAKKNHKQHPTLLTPDESAAIYLYTMAKTEFFSTLNSALRDQNREKLKPWISFLKILITALKKLPSTKATISRGVDYDATSELKTDKIYTYWNISSCTKNLSVAEMYVPQSGSLLIIEAIHGKDISMFSAVPDEQEVILMPGTRMRANSRTANILQSFFIIHLEEINFETTSTSESNCFLEQIKQKYQRNNRIERFVDPSKSLPIEQSYINLAIVDAKEVQKKEKELRDALHTITALDTFEEIYGMKTAIDIKDIFETCKNHEKQVLVFGRAGIGKSTFCRYIAYQWATGSYWSQYELLALIPLRCLTTHRYPPDKTYSLMDLVRREVLRVTLTEKEDGTLQKQLDPKKTLWVLDGYDEIAQNLPPHLQYLFEQLLETPHHILTSRPFMNTLPYDVKMEITGFTGDNIEEYVQRFFDQMKDELDDTIVKSQRLLKLLKSNHNIWGIAHIPVNLELICSLWISEDWSDTEPLTITILYTRMIEWLCRRYLEKTSTRILKLTQEEIHQRCQKELTFLETLAFNAMKSNTIILQSGILKTAFRKLGVSSEEYPHILNLGILKSLNKPGISKQIEAEKDHYFVHLSFQEYFAARFLINALKRSHIAEAIEFIKYQKYNQRFTLVFTFAAGLLNETNARSHFNLFWDHILGEPVDIVGIRHMQLVILCLEETSDKSTSHRCPELLKSIAQCIRYNITHNEDRITGKYLSQSLQTAQSVTSDQVIVNELVTSLQHTDTETREAALTFIADLKISNPSILLIKSVINTLDDRNEEVRRLACFALGNMSEKAATNEVITKLASVLEDKSDRVRSSARFALENMGEKAATNEVIIKLVSALEYQSDDARESACFTLREIGEKTATNEVTTTLANAFEDQNDDIRSSACVALRNMGDEAATNEVITKLVSALEDQSDEARSSACFTIGNMGEKAATNEVITKLVSALGDQSDHVRSCACVALGKMGEKAATNEVITKLVNALEDPSDSVRISACFTLGYMGETVATNEVITKLASVLGDKSDSVRSCAYSTIGRMGEKVVTNEVIIKLVSALEDQSDDVRSSACFALGKMGEKAATEEVITKLVNALVDQSGHVRSCACVALENMGEKIATNEVINKLIVTVSTYQGYSDRELERIIGNILNSSTVMMQLAPKAVTDICFRECTSDCFRNISEEDVISVYLTSKNLSWLPAVIQLTLLRGAAVAISDDKILLYGQREPIELPISDLVLRERLVDAFLQQRQRLHLFLREENKLPKSSRSYRRRSLLCCISGRNS